MNLRNLSDKYISTAHVYPVSESSAVRRQSLRFYDIRFHRRCLCSNRIIWKNKRDTFL